MVKGDDILFLSLINHLVLFHFIINTLIYIISSSTNYMKRYIIRDKETKKIKYMNNIKLDFGSYLSASLFLNKMDFGLGEFYEIYDINEEVVRK